MVVDGAADGMEHGCSYNFFLLGNLKIFQGRFRVRIWGQTTWNWCGVRVVALTGG